MAETAHKARWAGAGGAIACLALAYAGPYIGLPLPPIEDTADAFTRLVAGVVGYAGAFASAWAGPKNQPKKGDIPHAGGVQAPWWSVLGAAGLALLLMGGLAGCGLVGAAQRFEAANCTQTPLERAQNRQALIDSLGQERAEALFITCPEGSPGYHEALDGDTGGTHPLLE